MPQKVSRVLNVILRMLTIALALLILTVLGWNFYYARTAKAFNECEHNLRQIEAAKGIWAQNNGKSPNTLPRYSDIANYLRSDFPRCPDNGVYVLGRVGESPTCSIGGRFHTLQK